ncbi:hypothetical protein GJ496_009623 [Pomphorhynchus laevis]|nr:hypothetical protein GJ496_009623 [Pomphorhynchus laevis]
MHNASSDVPSENCTLQTGSNLVCSVDSVYNRAIPEEGAEHLTDRSIPTFDSSKIKCTFMLIGVHCQIILQKTPRPNSATIRKNITRRLRVKYVAPRSCWVPSFCNLMSLGKTRAAMRLLANPDKISPVMSLDQEIGGGQTVKDKLKELNFRGDSLNDIAV